MRLLNENYIWLTLTPFIIVMPLFLWAFWRKRKTLLKLAEVGLINRLTETASSPRKIVRALLVITAFILITFAAARPVSNPRPKQVKRKGRDIAVLLDVSRSMLAEDIRPNRLERAKIAVTDLLDVLQGDRIALITFAGSTTVKCPLTHDYAFMRLALSQVTTQSTARGGTMIGDAIRDAIDQLFDKKQQNYRDIILITDGEDHQSLPIPAAQKAGENNVRIIAIGLGDPIQGARIPITAPDGSKTFLKDKQGKEVWSKLGGKAGDTLRKIAFATPDGKYLPVETGTFDLGDIYRQISAQSRKRELESATQMQYDEQFYWPLAAAVILLMTEMMISERKQKK